MSQPYTWYTTKTFFFFIALEIEDIRRNSSLQARVWILRSRVLLGVCPQLRYRPASPVRIRYTTAVIRGVLAATKGSHELCRSWRTSPRNTRIGVSPTTCKYELGRNPRSHSWRVFLLKIERWQCAFCSRMCCRVCALQYVIQYSPYRGCCGMICAADCA